MKNAVITIQNVRDYEKDGTVYLNLEDTARGLGFTEIKNGIEYVMWRRVNQYLQNFGFGTSVENSQEVGKDAYIPENIFYRLAMKAKNEVAEKFQAKVADEILPTIRKTGNYSATPQKSLTSIVSAIADIGVTAENIQSLFAVSRGIALAQAIEIVSLNNNLQLNSLKKFLPSADHDTGFMNATQIGEKLGGVKPDIVNKMLANADMQYKDGKHWRITKFGKNFGEEMPFTKNGHSGYQIRWSEKFLNCLRS